MKQYYKYNSLHTYFIALNNKLLKGFTAIKALFDFNDWWDNYYIEIILRLYWDYIALNINIRLGWVGFKLMNTFWLIINLTLDMRYIPIDIYIKRILTIVYKYLKANTNKELNKQ